jgi:hypothetical protein
MAANPAVSLCFGTPPTERERASLHMYTLNNLELAVAPGLYSETKTNKPGGTHGE